MMHSVENRFIAIVCGAMLIFVAPLFVLFLSLSSERADKESCKDHRFRHARRQRPGAWPSRSGISTTDSVDPDRATTIAEGAIVKVHVRDLSGQLDRYPINHPEVLQGPAASPSPGRNHLQSARTAQEIVGTIEVWVSALGLFDGFSKDERDRLHLIFIVAV